MCHSQESRSHHSHVPDFQVTSNGEILVSISLQDLKDMQDEIRNLRAENAILRNLARIKVRDLDH